MLRKFIHLFVIINAIDWIYGTIEEVISDDLNALPLQSFEVVNEWKYLDFVYPSYTLRKQAIATGAFNPENNLPLGVDFQGNRIFLTTPRWKDGVPASLGYIEYPPKERSPPIRPYPNWAAHGDPYAPDCTKLISVYRTAIDQCHRLWVIDAGVVNATVSLNQICPPKIIAFDLSNDEIIVQYELPSDQVKQDSLHSNIVVDVRSDRCDDAHAYITDVWRFGITVFSLAKMRSWRLTNYNFSPNPIASDFNVYGLNFQWLDGVFGMSLSLEHSATNTDRILYFHPMASFKEFMVSTAILQDESLWPAKVQDVAKYFVEIGDRGQNSQSSTSSIDRDGVMFFTQVHRDSIGCWDTAKAYTRSNIARTRTGNFNSNSTRPLIQFPNDLKVDKEASQSVWVMSNRLPIYLYSRLDYGDVNFRILRANARDIVRNSVCDPTQNIKSQIYTATVYEGQCF